MSQNYPGPPVNDESHDDGLDDTVRLIRELTDAALGRTAPPVMAPKVDRNALAADLDVVTTLGHIDELPDPPGSMRGMKRAVLRVGAFNWMRQRAVNVSVGNLVAYLIAQLDHVYFTAAQSERRAAASVAAVEGQLADLRKLVTSVRDHNDAASARIKSLIEEHASELAAIRADLNETAGLLAGDPPSSAVSAMPRPERQ